MDTRLRVNELTLELQRAEIAQTLMQPLAIVETFDERKDLPACLLPRVIRLMVNELIF